MAGVVPSKLRTSPPSRLVSVALMYVALVESVVANAAPLKNVPEVATAITAPEVAAEATKSMVTVFVARTTPAVCQLE